MLAAERIENPAFVTVLVYGHGDTIRGLDDLWRPGLTPWRVVVEGERIYGRGTADNKGQHSVNIGGAGGGARRARRARLQLQIPDRNGARRSARSGLRELCERHRDDLLKADVLIASDGPRIAPASRRCFSARVARYLIDLFVDLREGSHHSGNWGGLIANPAIMLAQALASITDARGAIRVPEWRPAAAAIGARRAGRRAKSTAAMTARRSIATGASRA